MHTSIRSLQREIQVQVLVQIQVQGYLEGLRLRLESRVFNLEA